MEMSGRWKKRKNDRAFEFDLIEAFPLPSAEPSLRGESHTL